jgi:hypothetical protein
MKIFPNIQLSRNQFPWLLGVLLYLISYGGSFLFLDAIYWDDWIIFNKEPEVILDLFQQVGVPFNWTGHLHVALLKFGPEIYRFLTFILMFLSGYLLWLIVGTIAAISHLERNLIALFFMVLPLNAARIALVNFEYTICYFSFFLAWYLLVCRNGYISKVLSLVLFLFSFNTNSLLVFYALPIAHAVYLSAGFDLKKSIIWASKSFLFLLAPFAWFYIKTHFFAPTGLFDGYNSLKLVGIMRALLIGAPLGIIFIAWVVKERQGKNNPIDRGLVFLFWGMAITWLGVFPYLAVGLFPYFGDWHSRHQLLMPLGAALAIVGTGSWISYGNLLRFTLLLLAISSLVNLCSAFEYHVDWIKQREVMQLISRSGEIRAARTILFDDKTVHFNARGRTYRSYEYNGWFKLVYGDQTRWGMDEAAWKGPLTAKLPDRYKIYISKYHNASEYMLSAPDLIVIIKSSNSRLKTLVKKALTGSGGFSIDISKVKEGII